MEFGVAGMLAVKQISGDDIETKVNTWLSENGDAEVIDIKFSASATRDDWGTDALIIYRKEAE